jgi:hypothetical protein
VVLGFLIPIIEVIIKLTQKSSCQNNCHLKNYCPKSYFQNNSHIKVLKKMVLSKKSSKNFSSTNHQRNFRQKGSRQNCCHQKSSFYKSCCQKSSFQKMLSCKFSS